MVERHVTLMEEKQMILRRQQEEVNKLVNMQVGESTGEMTDRQTDSGMARRKSFGLKQRSGGVRHMWFLVRQASSPAATRAMLSSGVVCFPELFGLLSIVVSSNAPSLVDGSPRWGPSCWTGTRQLDPRPLDG